MIGMILSLIGWVLFVIIINIYQKHDYKNKVKEYYKNKSEIKEQKTFTEILSESIKNYN